MSQATPQLDRPTAQAELTRTIGVGFGDVLGGYVIRPTRIAVLPKGEPLFSEQCTVIEIEDEAAGEYLKIRQQSGKTDSENQTIAINPEEWPALKNAVDFMLKEIVANPPNA